MIYLKKNYQNDYFTNKIHVFMYVCKKKKNTR